MKILKKHYLILAIATIFFQACNNEDIINEVETKHEELAQPTQLVGKKLENPYTLSNMQKAFQLLMDDGASQKFRGNGLVEPQLTDYYVRFKIETHEDYTRLEQDSLHLFDFPIEYIVEEDGDEHVDGKGETKWIYTTVNKDYSFPKINYEILEELFLPESIDEDFSSQRSNSFLLALEDKAVEITGNSQTDSNQEERALMNRRTPQGTVRVWNTHTNNWEPVEGVRVRVNWFHRVGTGWTNGNGFYRVDKDFRYNVSYSVRFRNRLDFRVWSTMTAVHHAVHNLSDRRTNRGIDIDIARNSRAWRFATINNGVMKYRRHCQQLGITMPHDNLRIAALDNDSWSSAPMLRRTWGVMGFTTHSQLGNFFFKG